MALLEAESFDGWTTVEYVARGWYSTGGAQQAGVGRFGTSGLICAYDTFQISHQFPVSLTTSIVGIAAYHGINGISQGIFTLYRGGFGGNPQLMLVINGVTGFIEVWRGNGTTVRGTLLGSGSIALPYGQYRYVEMKSTINDSTGSVHVKVNGVTHINLTGIDTQNGVGATVDTIRVSDSAAGQQHGAQYDDYYLCDTTGSKNNDFLGDVRVENRLPNGNGTTSNLDGSDGNTTDNYLLVDDPTAPDNETTYVESSDVGDKDTYAYQNLTPTTGTVYGVIVKPYARKTDAGTRNIATIARLSGTEVDSADILLPANYAYLPQVYEDKPGGGDWTISDFNSAEFGVKVTA